MPIKSICNSHMGVQSCMQICAHTAYNREKIKQINKKTNKTETVDIDLKIMMVVTNEKIIDNPQGDEKLCLLWDYPGFYPVDEIMKHNAFKENSPKNDIAFVKVKFPFKGVKNMAKLPPHPASIIGTAVFFELFNFKMKFPTSLH